jgi:hypothetical protein
VKYQGHDRHEDQQVNQGAGDMKHEPAQYPQNGKKNEQDKKHRVSPFDGRRIARAYPIGRIARSSRLESLDAQECGYMGRSTGG